MGLIYRFFFKLKIELNTFSLFEILTELVTTIFPSEYIV